MAAAEDVLVLVDEEDREVGHEAKTPCHRHPVPLHRAFSVFLFDEGGRMLLTQRSAAKATWPGHWTNACCSHPRRGEATADAADRRLREELALTAPLEHLFVFTYAARYDDDWGENEVDHVFVGRHDGDVCPDPAEVADWRWVDVDALRCEVADDASLFTPWFLLAFERVVDQRPHSRR